MAGDVPAFDRFHRAWLAPELRLLGYVCRPFCLGHLMLFQGLGLPFARMGEPNMIVGVSDLILALRICSDGRWPFQAVDFKGEDGEKERWDQRLFRHLEARPGAFRKALDLFMEWLVECSTGPEMWDSEDCDAKPVTAPLVLGFATRLLRLGSMSERRIYTMSLALVRSYAAAVSEQEGGGAMFLTAGHLEAMAAADRLPNLLEKSDEEIYEIVKKDRGKDFADGWLARRRNPQPAGRN